MAERGLQSQPNYGEHVHIIYWCNRTYQGASTSTIILVSNTSTSAPLYSPQPTTPFPQLPVSTWSTQLLKKQQSCTSCISMHLIKHYWRKHSRLRVELSKIPRRSSYAGATNVLRIFGTWQMAIIFPPWGEGVYHTFQTL
jgi:hypothetical protein